MCLTELFELLDKGVGGVDSVKSELISCEEVLLLAPTRISLKNLGMTEPRTMIGKHARNRRRARLRTEALNKLITNQTELSRAHNVPAGSLPSLNNQLLFCDFCASSWLLLDLLDQTQRVITGDERDVLVSAEIVEQLEELARI